MAAQLYANTQLALSLYEVLQELVEEEKIPEPLAVSTLAQVSIISCNSSMHCRRCSVLSSAVTRQQGL